MDQPKPSRSVVHNTFVLERLYPAKPARVFGAFADIRSKRRWFSAPEGWEELAFELDFRVGGREVNTSRMTGSLKVDYIATYYDIVPDERLVYAYEMLFDDVRISVSLATVTLAPEGEGTRLVLTEQGAFLDGVDKPALREQGTRDLLEAIAAEVGPPLPA